MRYLPKARENCAYNFDDKEAIEYLKLIDSLQSDDEELWLSILKNFSSNGWRNYNYSDGFALYSKDGEKWLKVYRPKKNIEKIIICFCKCPEAIERFGEEKTFDEICEIAKRDLNSAFTRKDKDHIILIMRQTIEAIKSKCQRPIG